MPNEKLHVVVLAGGKGSRLKAVCQGLPKPLLDVGGQPLLGPILKQLLRACLVPHTVYVQPGDVQVGPFVKDLFVGSAIELLPCDLERGPFYWIHQVYRRTDATILALYSDFFAPHFDLCSFLAQARGMPQCLVAAIGPSLPTTQAAVFERTGDSVSGWHRSPLNAPTDLLNVGCYLLRHDRAVDTAFSECHTFLEDDVFPRLIKEAQLGAFVLPGPFINVNTPDNLDAARAYFRECQR